MRARRHSGIRYRNSVYLRSSGIRVEGTLRRLVGSLPVIQRPLSNEKLRHLPPSLHLRIDRASRRNFYLLEAGIEFPYRLCR